MPIFKIQPDGLVGLARVKAGPDLYEKEIEDLLWSNLEAFVGEDLFPVARQPTMMNASATDQPRRSANLAAASACIPGMTCW